MQVLAFPTFSFTIKSSEKKRFILDPIRKKFVLLTPEEWVRQHVIQDLMDKGISKTRLSVEKKFEVMGKQKRFDVVVAGANASIALLVECKAPEVPITQLTFDQIARYQLALKANYLMLTNGLQHIYCQIDYERQAYHFVPDFPSKVLAL
ncbi:MAG: restriction endonuclease subunit R [Flavobacteriaceae bacterium]|nr:restriction endonuclease subunit R [Flavobacteriaceae bacterium]|tara:strand:+ start:21317 stop:21766 length:450 start_codon:yes stop_codon:yes gene_type:complete